MNMRRGWAEVPTQTELMNPTLHAIRGLGGSASISQILDRVIIDMGLPSAVTLIPHLDGPMTELGYRLAWVRTYLKKYGLLMNPKRGVWSLTQRGAATESVDSAEITRSVIRDMRQAPQASAEHTPELEIGPSATDDDSSRLIRWQDRLLEALKAMQPDAFERLCERMLRESGFIEVEVTGRSGDGGIDGNGIIRLAGLISFPVLFQCKRYRNNVTSAAVRDFRGAMQGRADRGLILTTAGFTADAHREATRDGAPPIDLIDGDLLAGKLKELRLGVSVRSETVEIVEVDKEWLESL